ncbi:MAG: hypothetical protein MK110_17590 [Fuerstiella sp.]|nr:hypothetical protein [Fuerstiella sp.]
MKRRKFIQTIGTTAPIAAAANAAETVPDAVAVTRTEEPRVFVSDDGRHAAPLYQFAPELEPADHAFVLDQLVGSGVDTLIYFAGLEGGVALYDSRVVQKWGDNVVKWKHPVFYRAARHIQQLIDDGYDPLKVLCDRAHEKRVWLIAGNWVGLQGGDRTIDGGFGRKSDFVYDNPNFQVGTENDPRAEHVDPARFSFLHAKVRKERLSVFEEMLTRYETDGIELNLVDFAPFCLFSQAGQLSEVLTTWLRDLKVIAQRAEQRQGRRKRIYARIPSHPDAWKVLGYDVAGWVEGKLVDGFICLPALMEDPMDQAPDISEIVRLTRGTSCRVLTALNDTLGRQFEGYATAPMTWAAAANAYDQGADGFGISNYHHSPNGWPWTAEEYEKFRLLGHPDLLATADKLYRAPSMPRGISDGYWLPGVMPLLPQVLEQNQPVETQLRIADDLSKWEALGRVSSVRLRVRLTNIEPSLNEVRIELNGRQLPDRMLKLTDLTYRLYELGAVNPYGFVYEYELPAEWYPNRGNNTVTVTVAEYDPDIDFMFQVVDIDIVVNYCVHRHFERSPAAY